MVKNLKRLQLIRVAICFALIIGILLSIELWFPITRSFPRAPLLIELPEAIVPLVERVLSGMLMIFLTLTALVSSRKVSVTAIASLVLLIFFDQMRLQPWVYQYLVLLILLTLSTWHKQNESDINRTLGVLQLTVAALYFWSGLQKMNFSFTHEILPELLIPFQNFLPSNHSQEFVAIGLFIALAETLIGCGLLFVRTRNFSVCLAVAMHSIVLGLLISKSYNSIVWTWNGMLIVIVILLFWRCDLSIWRPVFAWYSVNWRGKMTTSIALFLSLVPVLSFWGYWDMYLSGALYSGNTAIAVVKVNEEVLENLPEKARVHVFQTKSAGEQMLPLFEWAMADLNVPVYPERRVFTYVAREVCKLAEEKSQMELVIKERPELFDGSYSLTRIPCPNLQSK